MITISNLVLEYSKESPLGKSILREEVPILMSHLRQRLGSSPAELDMTASSLRRLEMRLIEFYKAEGESLSEEETIVLVRELASYIGEVLHLHAKGKWEPLGTLWATHIVFSDIKITKEGKQYAASKINYSLGNIAAVSLDKIRAGIKPNLYKYYRNAKTKKFTEDV